MKHLQFPPLQLKKHLPNLRVISKKLYGYNRHNRKLYQEVYETNFVYICKRAFAQKDIKKWDYSFIWTALFDCNEKANRAFIRELCTGGTDIQILRDMIVLCFYFAAFASITNKQDGKEHKLGSN